MKRQELAAGSKPARCFRKRLSWGGGDCGVKETVRVTITVDLYMTRPSKFM